MSKLIVALLWGFITLVALYTLSLFVTLDTIPSWAWWSVFAYGGLYAGTFIVLFIMPLVPTLIQKLTNDPNRNKPDDPERARLRDYKVSEFGFFTEVSPGQVKILERGGRFIRCIMDYDEHMFYGDRTDIELNRDDRAYWRVVRVRSEKKTGKRIDDESRPIPRAPSLTDLKDGWFWAPLKLIFFPYRITWWVWENWVYKITGLVPTGIYPFQKVKVYPITRYKWEKEGETSGETGAEHVLRILDYSDHYRVADFQFPIVVPKADTQDMIPVKVRFDFVGRVYNAYSTAYDTDDWPTRLVTAQTDAVTHFTRANPVGEVLSDQRGDALTDYGRRFAKGVQSIGDISLIEKDNSRRPANNIVTFGLITSQILFSDISAANADDEKKLGELARARVDSKAEAERAIGRAADIREQSKAVRENGHMGLAVLAANRDERTATAAAKGNAIINIGTGGNADPIQAAILHELRQQNGNGKPQQESTKT